MLLDGKVAANVLKENLKQDFIKHYHNRAPKLAIIVSNNDDGSISYLKGRQKLASFLGVDVDIYECYQDSMDEMITLVEKLSNDDTVDGIMIDRPLNKWIDEEIIFSHLSAKKDIDGCTPISSGLLLQGLKGHASATARAVIELLKFYKIEIAGKNVAVIGRSKNVGKPLALLFNNENATVTICHSKTKDIPSICKTKDIVVVAIGQKEFVDESYFNPNCIVVDVGIHYDENGKMVGDVKRSVVDYVYAMSPVPGGVGPLTNIALMQNLLDYYKR